MRKNRLAWNGIPEQPAISLQVSLGTLPDGESLTIGNGTLWQRFIRYIIDYARR